MNFRKWLFDIEEVTTTAATTGASIAPFMRRVGSLVRRKKKKKGCKSYGAETPAKGEGGSCQLQEFEENFVSHSYEPLVGDEVINNNP